MSVSINVTTLDKIARFYMYTTFILLFKKQDMQNISHDHIYIPNVLFKR